MVWSIQLRAAFGNQGRHAVSAELLHQRPAAADAGAVRDEQIRIRVRQPCGGLLEMGRCVAAADGRPRRTYLVNTLATRGCGSGSSSNCCRQESEQVADRP